MSVYCVYREDAKRIYIFLHFKNTLEKRERANKTFGLEISFSSHSYVSILSVFRFLRSFEIHIFHLP